MKAPQSRAHISTTATCSPLKQPLVQVRDAYDGLEADATKMAARGKILAWRSTETDELVLYPKTVPGMPSMQVDADIVREWLAIKVGCLSGMTAPGCCCSALDASVAGSCLLSQIGLSQSHMHDMTCPSCAVSCEVGCGLATTLTCVIGCRCGLQALALVGSLLGWAAHLCGVNQLSIVRGLWPWIMLPVPP